jgi:UDP-GlcNAc:undecaprenyl-phosphate GlcNAc-1-phosphate transferase
MTEILSQTATQQPLTADQVISPYIWVAYAAFIVSFVFTPIMRRVALYFGIIDKPDPRKMHTRPVAYLGGLAVFLGWVAGLAVSQFVPLHRWLPGMDDHVIVHLSIVVGACVILVLGLWDDTVGISPKVKIAGQVAAACALLAAGIGTTMTEPFLRNILLRLDLRTGVAISPNTFAALVAGTSAMLTIMIIVFCCNAANLMDGLDGLCGGVTGIIAAGFLILAVNLAMQGQMEQTNWDALRVVLSLALLGSVLGFVPYNFNPASIFMGDTGSMFLGFSCGLSIILLAEVEAKWFLAAMVMFALPVLDTSLAFARRWVNGRPLFSPDKFHFHHQLVSRGLTVRKAVLLSYALAIGFVILGAAIVVMRTRYAGLAYLMIFGSIIVAAYKMGMVHERPRAVARRELSEGLSALAPSQRVEAGGTLEVADPRSGNGTGEIGAARDSVSQT